MVKCPFCFTTHVVNTVFCNECAQFLGEDSSISTEQFYAFEGDHPPIKWRQPQNISTAPIEKSSTKPQNSSTLRSLPVAICLHIGPNKKEIQLQIDEPVYIGRIDPGQDIFPDVDLTRYNIEAKAISRRHVRLFVQNQAVMIEDLDSLNGTYLNEERLPPYLSVTLSDGDKLKLGMLQMEVAFVRTE